MGTFRKTVSVMQETSQNFKMRLQYSKIWWKVYQAVVLCRLFPPGVPRLSNLQVVGMAESSARACGRTISATTTGTATNFLRSAIVQKHRSAVADFPRLPNLQVKGMAESSARACRRKIIATATGTARIVLTSSANVQKHRSAVPTKLRKSNYDSKY